MKNFALRLRSLNHHIGQGVSWLTLLMVVATFVTVILRYWLDTGSIKLQESVIYMHGIVFMLGAAYTYAHEEHVRVDIFYRKWSPKKQVAIDLIGNLLLLLPVISFIFWMSLDYVLASWRIFESSSEAAGLPGLYLLKSLLLIMPLLLLIQCISNLILYSGILFFNWPVSVLQQTKKDNPADGELEI